MRTIVVQKETIVGEKWLGLGIFVLGKRVGKHNLPVVCSLVIVVGCKKTDYTPDPLHTPAQNASTSLPSFSSSSGLISDSGTLRTQRSCVVGLRFGLNLR